MRQLDIAPFDGAVVGRVDAPPGSVVIDLHPGVRGSLALDEAVDVARGDVGCPAEGEEDVGVVLTDALPQGERLRRRGGGLGDSGLVAHVLIDPGGEGEGLALRRAPGEGLCDLPQLSVACVTPSEGWRKSDCLSSRWQLFSQGTQRSRNPCRLTGALKRRMV